MTPQAARTTKIFINLPIKHLQRSVEFFTKLGFAFNQQFTDEHAACMILSEEAFVMLLVESRFKDFTSRQICDTRTHVEGLFSLSAASRADVDHVADTALAAGGTFVEDPQDYGFMYTRSFQDLDGHSWSVLWMDPNHLQK
ncbi:VOC family protein [Nannocystis punicea]|uniref:VOC family protein n=1 Tax=Nannocystis punicea TaxID=2995304 RepID=A0ABY7GW98_9BACT|nr:VOC family protein [Nannocystis poenicansa]WAS91159.1 VOC family protein [Nannocystis poenicansa]